MSIDRVQSSFRDPSGFLFRREGILYRQINKKYAEDYLHLMDSGLYKNLVNRNFLIPHTEVDIIPAYEGDSFKVIRPHLVPFISYPYEWSFSMVKDSALRTLDIQEYALEYDMSLKDASAYNIQFNAGTICLIDTLSFERYKEGEPWVAYKQFCQHFLAPLALMAKVDIRFLQLLRIYIDGLPLDLASRLLPVSSYLEFGLLTHIHLHSRAQLKYAHHENKPSAKVVMGNMNKQSLLALIENLKGTIQSLNWKPAGTDWADYYSFTNYSAETFEQKKQIILEWTSRINPLSVWDMGANTGVFTRIASNLGIPSISFDIDPAAVEKNYRQAKLAEEKFILPLLQDLTNPSPALGWQNSERASLLERAPADMIFALAIIHHLAISNNVPLSHLAEFFSKLGKWLVIEFVPKSDTQVQKLLATRQDIFDEYSIEAFEHYFMAQFDIREKVALLGSERYLYLMERR